MSANGAAKATSITDAPLSASFAATASSSALVSGDASSQIGVRQKPMRGRAMARSILTGGSLSTAPRNSAMSSSVRAIRPSVSTEWHCILMPTREKSPKVGL